MRGRWMSSGVVFLCLRVCCYLCSRWSGEAESLGVRPRGLVYASTYGVLLAESPATDAPSQVLGTSRPAKC